jgi:hypothetical protein
MIMAIFLRIVCLRVCVYACVRVCVCFELVNTIEFDMGVYLLM